MDIVDAHLHLFKAISAEYPRDVFEGMTPPEREESVELFLHAMDAAGVDRAVIVPVSAHHTYIGEVVRAHPARFASVGVLDPEAEDPVAELGRMYAEAGIQGLRLFGLEGDADADPRSLRLFPLLERMQDQDMKVWFYGPPDQLRLLDRVLEDLPDLVVVLNHQGFLPDMHAEMRVDEHGRPRFVVPLPPPGLELVEEVAARRPTVHVHFSGHYAFSQQPYPHEDLRPVAERLLAAFGADRMMMASDWPWIRDEPGYGATLAIVDELLPGLTADERDSIRGGTAMSLFRF